MNRSNKRYITKIITKHKSCKENIIDMLKTELNDMSSILHELINKYESKKEEISFITDLKYNPKRKVNKDV